MVDSATALLLKPYVLMLRGRLRLAEPDQQSDPMFQIPDEELEDILMGAITTHNPMYTLQTLPSNEVQFVMWLAQVEVYYMLATESAQYYQIEAQGAVLNRQQLFDHYQKLAEKLQDKYDIAWSKFMTQTWEAQSVDVVLENRYTPRNYRLIAPPTITLSVVAQTPTSISLQWTPITDRQISGYVIYKSQSEIIDEFSDEQNLIDPKADSMFYSPDVWKTKYRIDNLVAGQTYNFAVYAVDVYGRKCWSELSIQQPTTTGQPITILATNQSSPQSVN